MRSTLPCPVCRHTLTVVVGSGSLGCPFCRSAIQFADGRVPVGEKVRCGRCQGVFTAEQPPTGIHVFPCVVEKCPGCQTALALPSDLPGGRKVRCPQCSQPFLPQTQRPMTGWHAPPELLPPAPPPRPAPPARPAPPRPAPAPPRPRSKTVLALDAARAAATADETAPAPVMNSVADIDLGLNDPPTTPDPTRPAPAMQAKLNGAKTAAPPKPAPKPKPVVKPKPAPEEAPRPQPAPKPAPARADDEPGVDWMRLGMYAGLVGLVGVCGYLLFSAVTSGGRPALYPVTGVVMYKGKPAVGARVYLFPEVRTAENLLPSGLVGADGAFTVTTYEPDDGAPAGRYKVSVIRNQLDEDALAQLGKKHPPAEVRKMASEAAREPLKKQYADPHTSKLSAEVKGGGTKLEYDLK